MDTTRTSGRSRFLRDATSLQIAGSLAQVSQLGSAIALAFLLGAKGQGLFVSAIALHALGHCLINIGVPQATASQISASAARGRAEKVASWVAFLTKVNLLFSSWMVVIGYLIFPYLAERFLHDRQIGVWASWLTLGPILELPRDVVRVALQGTRRMGTLGAVENGQELLRFFLVVIGALISGSPAGAILGSLSASALSSLVALSLYRSIRHDGGTPLPRVREVVAGLRDIPIRQGLRQGVRISVFKNLHTLLLMVMPRLVIQALVGANWVAYYHIAQRLMSAPQVLSAAISRTALPAMSELAGHQDGPAFRRLFARASLSTGVAITAAIWTGLMIVPWFLGLLFPPDYGEPVLRFAMILAVAESIGAFGVCLEAFFISANRLRGLYITGLVGFLITSPIALWLVFRVETTGVAWGVVALRSINLLQLAYAASFLWGRRGLSELWPSKSGPRHEDMAEARAPAADGGGRAD